MVSSILILIGFVFLIKGADMLIDGASSVARQYNISDLVIGLTVVAFGTSSPELFVNIVASVKGSAGIAIGNIIGSTIANIFLVLGIAAVIFPLAIGKGTAWKEIPFGLFAVALLGVIVSDALLFNSAESRLSRLDSGILLFLFILFMRYSFHIAQRGRDDAHVPSKQHSLRRAGILIISGLVGLILGGKWIVDGAVDLARVFGVSESLIGFTIVAIGTCLPEVATVIVAAIKKNAEIAIGGIVGSNIFNILFVLGISGFIQPLSFNNENSIDIGVMIIAHVLLFGTMLTGKKRVIDRWEGIVFLLLYGGYISFLIVRG